MFNYKSSYHISLQSKRVAYDKFLEKLSTWISLNTFFLTLNVSNGSSKTCSLKIFSWFWFAGIMDYRKIPKILTPGAYISQRPFLRGFFIGAVYTWRGLDIRREICVTKSTTLMLERKWASQDRLGRKGMSVRFYWYSPWRCRSF